MLNSTNACRLLRTAAPIASRRLIHVTPIARSGSTPPGKDPQLSQGTTGPERTNNHSPQDVQSESARRGHEGRKVHPTSPHDAATDGTMPRAPHSEGSPGNPESIGLREQVGGATASAQKGPGGHKGGEEEASAPGYIGAIKQALGLASSRDVKRDDRRSFHTTAVALAAGTRADPVGACDPKDNTYAEQNAHLRHKQDRRPDSGRGNAGANPTLPSQKTPQTRANAPHGRPLGNPEADPEQQSPGPVPAESALEQQARKQGETEPGSLAQHEHNVQAWPGASRNGSNSATFTSAKRPKNSYGTGSASGFGEFHTSALVRAGPEQHSAESYFKDVDDTPSETPGVHKVDSSNAALDSKGREQATGPYHQTSMNGDEYKTVSKKEPYGEPTPAPEKGTQREEKLRYGGVDKQTSGSSGPRDSPVDGNKGGRGPVSS